MRTFWNSGQRESTTGLDILGIRQFDRALEQSLVAGITTISFRARYMSLLPWLVAEFWRRESAAGGGAATFDWDRFGAVQQRFEFVVLACTALTSDPGSVQGVLGADIFSAQVGELREGRTVATPTGDSGRTYGTYVMPCRSFGLLQTTASDVLPIQVMPRGAELYAVRSAACANSQLLEVIFNGGTVAPEVVRAEAPLFSVNGIAGVPKEQTLLVTAMTTAFTELPGVVSQYERFRATSAWLFSRLDDQPKYSPALIAEVYSNAVVNPDGGGHVGNQWAEFELRRRVHCCLELLLSSITDELRDPEDRTVDGVIARWGRQATVPEFLMKITGHEDVRYESTVGEFDETIPFDSFLAGPLPLGSLRSLTPPFRALAALALLLCCQKQTAALRAKGQIPDRTHYVERAFRVLSDCRTSPLGDCMRAIVRLVVEQHLATTLRKMGQGQKCSLRFYPERGRLIPTGLDVSPGFSGDRLGNVMNMWADVGSLERVPNEGLKLSGTGRAAMAQGAFNA